MSVYRRGKDATYSYDFQLGRRRFTGNTGRSSRREAEKVEDQARERARLEIAAGVSRADAPMTLGMATCRYWEEVGQHHKASDTTLHYLLGLEKRFGREVPLESIDDNAVARAVAIRRQETVKGRATFRDPRDARKVIPAPRISAATVNRSLTEPLQKVMNRARDVWKVALPAMPTWKRHLLKEPVERVREVRPEEEHLLDEAVRPDYQPILAFARESGLRLSEALLRKDAVDLKSGRIETVGKGGKRIRLPITTAMREILVTEMTKVANTTDYVFTYCALRARPGKDGWAAGDLRPITASGLKTMWRRARHSADGAAIPGDLRWHDATRHDFATKLLRTTRNLKLTQRAMNHAKIETTVKYAHVLDEEVAAGMEAAAKARAKSRKKSRKRGGGLA